MSVMYGVFQWAGFDLSSAPVCSVKTMLLVLLLLNKSRSPKHKWHRDDTVTERLRIEAFICGVVYSAAWFGLQAISYLDCQAAQVP